MRTKQIFRKLMLAAILVASIPIRAKCDAPISESAAERSTLAPNCHKRLTPAERQERRGKMRAKLAELREKKANGTLNLKQEQALERLEKWEMLADRLEKSKQHVQPQQ